METVYLSLIRAYQFTQYIFPNKKHNTLTASIAIKKILWKTLNLNWSSGKLTSILVSLIIKISTLPLTNSIENSSLFLSELIFKWAKTSLLTWFMHMKFSSLLKMTFWEKDAHSLTSEFPSSLSFISCQSKMFEMASTKLLLKNWNTWLTEMQLTFLGVSWMDSFVLSMKKKMFSIQNCFKYPFI